jgi:hypothetical protein
MVISINENNWFAESMFFVGVHWMEFVSHVKFRQLQTQRWAYQNNTFSLVEFTTTCAIVVYHHLRCEFEPHSWRGVLDTTLIM